MKLDENLNPVELELQNVPDEVAEHFLSSGDWKDRLRRSLSYPDTQDIDDVLPLPISGNTKFSGGCIFIKEKKYIF